MTFFTYLIGPSSKSAGWVEPVILNVTWSRWTAPVVYLEFLVARREFHKPLMKRS